MFNVFFRVALAALFYAGAIVSAFVGYGIAAIAAFAALVLIVAPAAAATIDLSPVVEMAFQFGNELLYGLLLLLGTYLATLLKRKTGIDLAIMQQGDNRMFHDGLRRGVDSLEALLRNKVVRDRELTLTVESPIVAALANRMLAASPGLLKRMGISEDELRERVLEHVTMKLNQLAL